MCSYQQTAETAAADVAAGAGPDEVGGYENAGAANLDKSDEN
jgi:hypothetical protein